MTRRRSHAVLCIAAALGCSSMVRATEPRPISSVLRDSASFQAVLPPDHLARTAVGEWEYVLTDTRSCDHGMLRPCSPLSRADAPAGVRGRFVVSDSMFLRFPARGLGRSSLPRFDLALGRSVSCTEDDWGLMRVDREGDSLTISFTPHAADCGVSATVFPRGDTLVGWWVEHGFAGPRARGRISLLRRARRVSR